MFDGFGVCFTGAAHLRELCAERRRQDHRTRARHVPRQSVFSGPGGVQHALHMQPVDRYSAAICRPRSLAQDHTDFGQRHEGHSQVCESLQQLTHTRGSRRAPPVAKAPRKRRAISDQRAMIACKIAKLLIGLRVERTCPPPREQRPGSPTLLPHEVWRSGGLKFTPAANCRHAHCSG